MPRGTGQTRRPAPPRPGRPEPGAIRKDPGCGLNVALVCPAPYRVGAANLGLQMVYGWFGARADALAERAFLPPRDGAPRTLESGRPLSAFDLLAVSLSFENDAPGIVRMLAASGLAPRAADRGPRDPLVVVGGVAATLNPAPLLPVVDAVALGEAEVLLPGLLGALGPMRGAPRSERLEALATVAGIRISGGPTAERVWVPDLDAVPVPRTVVACPAAEMGDLDLVEVSRGCVRGCRFCATGYVWRPPRFRSADSLAPALRAAAAGGGRVGLVGADLADHPDAERLVALVTEAGGTASPASLRADRVPDAVLQRLGASGLRTLTLAPETGDEALRRAVSKPIPDAAFVEAARRAGAAGIRHLKLYFLLGLPGQDAADQDAAARLVRAVRQALEQATGRSFGGSGMVTAAASPFVPKAGTPLQWAPMASGAELRRQGKALRRQLGRIGGVQVTLGSPREAFRQALLARGGEEVGEALLAADAAGGKLEDALAAAGHDPEAIARAGRALAADLPWDGVVHGPENRYLQQEWTRFRAGQPSPECDTETCRRCRFCRSGADITT